MCCIPRRRGRIQSGYQRNYDLIVRFEEFVLDADRRELTQNGQLVPVQPQVFDLLKYIIDNRAVVVTRDDLIEHVWNGRVVSESTLATRINAARKALGDDGTAQRLIRTVHGKGIRFVGTVVQSENQEFTTETPVFGNEQVELFLQESLVADAETKLKLISTELQEQLIIALSGQVFYFVKLGDPPTDPSNPGYYITSSIRRFDFLARLSIKLFSTGSSKLLWAANFDIDIDAGTTDLQSTVEKISNHVFFDISEDRIRRASSKKIDTADAVDLFYKARPLFRSKIFEENFTAELMLKRSAELQPELFSGHIGLAIVYIVRASSVWSKDVVGDLEKSRLAASAAANIEERAFAPVMMLAIVAAYQRRFEAALEYANVAHKLDPTNFNTTVIRGLILSYLGQNEEALDLLHASQQANEDDNKFNNLNLGRAYFINGDYELAIPKLEMFVGMAPAAELAQLFLGNCYDATGQKDKAQACVNTQLLLCPHTTIERTTFVTPYPEETLTSFHAFLRDHNVPET